jgi:hypothetical protein
MKGATLMKEYIYLDTRFLNSTLAQLGNGLMMGSRVSTQKGSTRSEAEETEQSKGINGFLKIGVNLHKTASDSSSFQVSSSTERVIDSVLDDQAVQVLQSHLRETESLRNTAVGSAEGNFIDVSSEFRLYDFAFLSTILEHDNLDLIRNQDDLHRELKTNTNRLENFRKMNSKTPETVMATERLQKRNDKLRGRLANDEQGWENFDIMHDAAQFFNSVFPNSILIKMDHALVYCNRDFFRENAAQLSILAESNRKLTILGSVNAITKKRGENEEFRQFDSNEMNVVPGMLSRILLSNFGMLDEDMTALVRPIAISFES